MDQVCEIPIGFFGPSDPEDPVGGAVWRAAEAALSEANANGGFHGKPFRLVPAWSSDPWGTGVRDLTKLVYQQQVWAIVGGIDGASTHLAEQVVAKARLTLISPISTDKTVNLANVPWMFSLAPGDHLIAKCLAPRIAASVGDDGCVLIAATDHDSYHFRRELRKALNQFQVVPAFQFEFKPGSDEWVPLVRNSLAARPAAIIVVAPAGDSLQLVRRLRRAGFAGPMFGDPRMGRDAFVKQIGSEAGQLYFPLLTESPSVPHELPDRDALPADADYAALQTYDAVKLTIEAIRAAGLNRVEIGRAVRGLSPWQGRAGIVRWDSLGSNTRRVQLGTIRNGSIAPLDNDGAVRYSP